MNRWGIIFDFGGVLSLPQGSRAVLNREGADWELDANTLIERLFSGPVWEQASRGEIPPARYWEHVSQHLPTPLADNLTPFANDPFFGESLDEEMLALVREVRAAGHQTALCSNALPGLVRHLSKHPHLLHQFDVVVVSALVGSRKPEWQIYRTTVSRLRLPAHRCVLIDDRERNTRAAQALGIHAIVHQNADATRRALVEMGILPSPGA